MARAPDKTRAYVMPVTDHHDPLDPIETALAEFGEAERAGVFGRTPLPGREAWEDKPTTIKFPLRTLRRLAIAATIALAVGVWSWTYSTRQSSLPMQPHKATSLQFADSGTIQASIARCISGPTGSVDAACGGVDFDGDGDVDLADFSSFQASFAVQR